MNVEMNSECGRTNITSVSKNYPNHVLCDTKFLKCHVQQVASA